MNTTITSFTDVLVDEICNSQPLSLSLSLESRPSNEDAGVILRPPKGTGQRGQFRSTEEVDPKYRDVFSYPYFNLVQSSVIEDALYSDKSIVVCAPTGSGKTVVFEMAIVQLLMELEEKRYNEDFKVIYMAPVKALCTERLTEWYPKFTRLGLLCIEVTGDTDVDFTQLKPYKIIITTPEKWDMLTRRWRDHRGLVEVIKLFLIDEVHILNDETRGPVLEAVVSRMKTIEKSAQSVHRIEQLQKEIQGQTISNKSAPRIRFVAVSATVSNPEDVANWLGTSDKPAVFYKFGDECRPVKLNRIVEGYPCSEGTSIFKFDIILNYKLWPIIQKYHSGKPTLIFCNTRKSVVLTAEILSRELTISFNAEQKAKLAAIASSIKNKKLQALVMSGVGCHHAGLLYEERQNMEFAFRNRDLPILITTTTLAMGVNLPAHLVIVKNTQQYVKGAFQEYSISTVLQMMGRAGRPQFDTEATAVIMTRLVDKPRYQALVDGSEPLQSYLHKRLAENLNSEAALGTVGDVAQCVQWLRSTFLYVRAAQDPRKYLGLPQNSPQHLISKKIEELCVKAMNGLASSGLITMDEASCIESTEAGRLMSIFYLDLETMKQIMKKMADVLNLTIKGTESLEHLLVLICESHELADMHLRIDERRCLNLLNRNNAAATIRFPMKGKITTRQMKLNCVIQAVLGCLPIPDPSLNQEAMKIMRITDRVCKCLVTYVTRPDLIFQQPQFFTAVLNSILLAKCVAAHLWENSSFVSKQLKGIGPTFSTLLASAGKVNFMLLEESHPRDLERIMNKGPPAGNVLRKQVSLLPKYQLMMIPVDENTVAVQLVLLNQSHLAENMESLTAGDSHKSYIVVGDSNNNLLLLTAFNRVERRHYVMRRMQRYQLRLYYAQDEMAVALTSAKKIEYYSRDRDLLSVFDGTITHEVRRKHNFEHKIFAHCVSSTFVGIDVQAEYMFNDLEPFLRGTAPCIATPTNTISTKKAAQRQTSITDTFKQRKRKINSDAIEKSKEKRKRENSLIENFKYLKQSLETASKNVNKSMHNQSRQNYESLNKTDPWSLSSNTMSNTPSAVNTNSAKDKLNDLSNQNTCYEEMDSNEFIDEENIDSILNEIENEMGKSKASLDNKKPSSTHTYFREKNINVQNPISTKLRADALKSLSLQNSPTNSSSYKTLSAPRKPKPKTPKSNYTFIELLERKLTISDDEDKSEVVQKDNGFSDTIKSHIKKFLTKTETKTSIHDRNIKMLLDKPDDLLQNGDEKTPEITPNEVDCEILNSPIQSPYLRYEMKEILSGRKIIEPNGNIQQTENIKNVSCNQDSTDCDIMMNIDKFEKQFIFNEVATSHSDNDIKALTPLHEIHNIILDDEDSRNNIDSEVKEDDLDDTLILNFDESSEILAINEHVERELDNYNEMNENDLDDIICVEEYKFKKENMNTLLDKDVIMINPTEISDEISNNKNTDMNGQCLHINENNLAKESIVMGRSNNNPSYVVPDNEDFQKLYDSDLIDAPAKIPCTDIVLKNINKFIASDRASHDKTLAIEGIGRNLYEPTKVNALANNPCSNIVLKNINQLIEHNRVSHDKTLAIEDIGRSKRSNQAQCYKSIYYPSVCNGLYPSYDLINNNQNNSSSSRNNTEINKQKAEYVKRCTYSTSKIDVSTKHTPEYCVQVIKKVKMDLDITAIVSRKHNYSKNYKSDCEKTSTNNKRMKIIALPKFKNTCQNTTEDNNKIINTVNNEIRNTSKVNLLSARLIRPEFPAIRNVVKLPNKAIVEDENTSNNQHNMNKSKGLNKNDSVMNNEQSNSNADEIQILEKSKNGELEEQDNHNDKYENTSGKSIETESGNVTGDSKIRNLLQKYSKILTKNAVKTVTDPSCSVINRTVTSNSSTTIKSQKPFKISDIHKLHATLPETIVDNKPEIGKDILRFPKVNFYVEAKKKREDLNSSRYTQDTGMRPTEQIPEYESITDLDLESISLPANVGLECTDYKIDQTMFDPRTLLQCVADDDTDEIVPPPPEFCDGMTYSPGYDNAEASMADDRVSERAPQLDIFTEKEMQYNESIFDDSYATDLTPSMEIETWNLSEEDGWNPRNAMNTSPAQSFIMRKNTNNDYNFLQNSIMSRQEKLGKFKFMQKKRFQMKK